MNVPRSLPWAVGFYRPEGQPDDAPAHLAIWPASVPKGALGDPICLVAPPEECTPQDEEHAAFIVHACNLHRALVEVAQQLVDRGIADAPTMNKARAVLAQVNATPAFSVGDIRALPEKRHL